MKINIQAKSLTEGVRYVQPVREVSLYSETERDAVFIIETLQQELMEGSPTQQAKNVKKMKRVLRGFVTVLVASIQTAPKAFAATADVANQTITPSLILKWGTSLALLGVSASISLAMIMLIVASFYKMMRKGDVANQWSSDIVKGLVQSLVAIPLVSLLFYISQMIFKNLPALGSFF